MSKTAGKYQIPFDENGNMREYPNHYGDTFWRDNDPFHADMQVIGYERGRSAVRVILKDSTERKWPMFISDLVDLIKTSDILDGKVSGQWVGTKKGQNYGIKRIPGVAK